MLREASGGSGLRIQQRRGRRRSGGPEALRFCSARVERVSRRLPTLSGLCGILVIAVAAIGIHGKAGKAGPVVGL